MEDACFRLFFQIETASPRGLFHLLTIPFRPPEIREAILTRIRGSAGPAGEARYFGSQIGSNFSLYSRNPESCRNALRDGKRRIQNGSTRKENQDPQGRIEAPYQIKPPVSLSLTPKHKLDKKIIHDAVRCLRQMPHEVRATIPPSRLR